MSGPEIVVTCTPTLHCKFKAQLAERQTDKQYEIGFKSWSGSSAHKVLLLRQTCVNSLAGHLVVVSPDAV